MQMPQTAARSLLFPAALLPLCAVVLACGSSSSESPSTPTVPTPSQGRTPGGQPKGQGTGAGDATGDQSKTARLVRSDLDDSMIAPCTKGQAFARGLCWDEVHFKPTGVFLNRPGETWTYFENGALVSDFIKASHVYLREEARFVGNFASTSLFRNAGVTRLNEWLFSFLQPRADGSMPPPGKVQGEYAFLPEDIGIAAPNDARSLEVARVNDATFRLQSSVLFTDPDGSTDVRQWPLEGTIEVCGAALRIAAMTQGDIAKACNDEPYNDGGDLRFKIPNGIMRLRLAIAPIPSEMKPYQVSYHLEFPEFE